MGYPIKLLCTEVGQQYTIKDKAEGVRVLSRLKFLEDNFKAQADTDAGTQTTNMERQMIKKKRMQKEDLEG